MNRRDARPWRRGQYRSIGCIEAGGRRGGSTVIGVPRAREQPNSCRPTVPGAAKRADDADADRLGRDRVLDERVQRGGERARRQRHHALEHVGSADRAIFHGRHAVAADFQRGHAGCRYDHEQLPARLSAERFERWDHVDRGDHRDRGHGAGEPSPSRRKPLGAHPDQPDGHERHHVVDSRNECLWSGVVADGVGRDRVVDGQHQRRRECTGRQRDHALEQLGCPDRPIISGRHAIDPDLQPAHVGCRNDDN